MPVQKGYKQLVPGQFEPIDTTLDSKFLNRTFNDFLAEYLNFISEEKEQPSSGFSQADVCLWSFASANKILNACTLRHGRTNQHYVKKLQRHIEDQMKMSFTQGYFILPEINTSKENQEWYNRVELETLDLAMRYIEDID